MSDGHRPSPKGVRVQLLWGLQLGVASVASSLLADHAVSQIVQLKWHLE
jgi:hypothetical protein